MRQISCFVFAFVSLPVVADDLVPLMTVPQAKVVDDDFSKSHPLPKAKWQTRQGTRWAIEDGVLRGRESSAEFQAKKKDHFGYEPRLSVPVTPPEFVASFSIRFIDGEETAIVPFIEFGHHVCRVRFSKQGAMLIAEHETMKLAQATDLVWKSGKWYQMMAEMKDGEFVLQIKDGPTLYAAHETFKKPPTSGGNGFGVAGPRHGLVEIDSLKISRVADRHASGWEVRRSKFPEFTPVQIKKPKAKKR